MTIQKRNRRLRVLAARAAAFDIYSGGHAAAAATLGHERLLSFRIDRRWFWFWEGLPACQARVGRGFLRTPVLP